MSKSDDLISRQAAIDVLSLGKEILSRVLDDTDVVGVDREKYSWGLGLIESCIEDIEELPSAQPDGIPLEWIDKHLEWLDNCDNDFAQLAKVGIRAMVEIWKKDKT